VPEPVTIEELVREAPFIDDFREAMLAVCRDRGIERGGVLVCVYGFEFYGRRATRPFAGGRLKYLGSFLYNE
jgi:hypothetical protein